MNALPSAPKQSMIDFAKGMINSSTFLSHILVDDNTLNSDQTKDLLTTITAASCVYALDYLDISDANFDSDETCTELANFLNKANDLYSLTISDQNGSRIITVSCSPSTDTSVPNGSI